jgi:hypothetical protein
MTEHTTTPGKEIQPSAAADHGRGGKQIIARDLVETVNRKTCLDPVKDDRSREPKQKKKRGLARFGGPISLYLYLSLLTLKAAVTV